MPTAKEIVDQLETMPVIEFSNFLREFNERFGAVVNVDILSIPEKRKIRETPRYYNIVLVDFAQSRLVETIVCLRKLFFLGLKEAKDIVESLSSKPYKVSGSFTKEQADDILAMLDQAQIHAVKEEE